MSDKQEALKLWVIGVLMVITVNFMRCNKAIPQDTTRVTFSKLEGRAGETTCDSLGKTVITIDESFRDSPAFPAILEHEMTHVRQLAKAGGCKKGMKKYISDPWTRFTMESEAYCVQLKYVRPEYRSRVEDHFLLFLLINYETKKTNKEAAIHFLTTCRNMTDPDGTSVQPKGG